MRISKQPREGSAPALFGRAGQVCIRIKRVYVHRDIADQYVSRVVDIASRSILGRMLGRLSGRTPGKMSTEWSMARSRTGPNYYWATRSKVRVTSMSRRSCWLDRDDLEVTRKETFGRGARSSDRGRAMRNRRVEKANDTNYGLGATIWTRDQSKAIAIGIVP